MRVVGQRTRATTAMRRVLPTGLGSSATPRSVSLWRENYTGERLDDTRNG